MAMTAAAGRAPPGLRSDSRRRHLGCSVRHQGDKASSRLGPKSTHLDALPREDAQLEGVAWFCRPGNKETHLQVAKVMWGSTAPSGGAAAKARSEAARRVVPGRAHLQLRPAVRRASPGERPLPTSNAQVEGQLDAPERGPYAAPRHRLRLRGVPGWVVASDRPLPAGAAFAHLEATRPIGAAMAGAGLPAAPGDRREDKPTWRFVDTPSQRPLRVGCSPARGLERWSPRYAVEDEEGTLAAEVDGPILNLKYRVIHAPW